MDLEFIALLITLLGGFGGTYAFLWEMKSEIEKNKREFAKCPLHCKEGMNYD